MIRPSAHRRFNPLREEWVLVSPQRDTRPWQGEIERPVPEPNVAYDPHCYLCPGNERARGARNPTYQSTFAFDNDYPALGPAPMPLPAPVIHPPSPAAGFKDESGPEAREAPHGDAGDGEDSLLLECPERGICRVLCFSPRHDLTIARMDVAAVRLVVDAWVGESEAIAEQPWVHYALIFENRGTMMGASNPHPHCQIWATETVPNDPTREQHAFDRYRARHRRCLLCDYAEREAQLQTRIVCANDGFIAIVPFWATWPFETLVVSKRHVGAIGALDAGERDALADILKRLPTKYDNLFEAPFPYSMGFHQEPLNRTAAHDWHLHAHYYPPLLRSAAVRKFMVGFELLGSPQRDHTPEHAAALLRKAGSR